MPSTIDSAPPVSGDSAPPASRPRATVLVVACALALAGPTALAFFSGGYFDEARAWAGLAAWLLVAVTALATPGAVPRGRPALLALGALALLSAWTLLSTLWAPVAGSAYHAAQLAVLYLGAMLASAMLLRGRAVRAVEPALTAGTAIVVGYGLSERFLPGLIHLTSSVTSEGRLDQPLSYWNAMGELAAIGFVLAARMSGDVSRRPLLRALAAAAAAPLGMGIYLTFSRGALFACGAGLVALIVFVPRREQLRAVALALITGALGALAGSQFRGVTALSGSLGTRELQGAIAFGLVVLLALLAALVSVRLGRMRGGEVRLPRRAPLIALAVICAGLTLAIVLGAKESTKLPQGTNAARFTTLRSDRYEYWRVALDAFAAQPIRGVGAGGWAVWWLEKRRLNSYAVDAHSLPLQTLAELGLVGFALLLCAIAGVALAGREALSRAGPLAAGLLAGLVVWLAHSPLDWDWEMPALTLIAMVMAGAVIAVSESPRTASPPAPALAEPGRGRDRSHAFSA